MTKNQQSYDHVLRKFENKIFQITESLIVNYTESINTKARNQHNSMFKVFINHYKYIHVKFISHDCTFEEINQLMFFFDILRSHGKVHDN